MARAPASYWYKNVGPGKVLLAGVLLVRALGGLTSRLFAWTPGTTRTHAIFLHVRLRRPLLFDVQDRFLFALLSVAFLLVVMCHCARFPIGAKIDQNRTRPFARR